MKILFIFLFISTSVYSSDTIKIKSFSAQKHIRELSLGIKTYNDLNNQYFSPYTPNLSLSIWSENIRYSRRGGPISGDLYISIQLSPFLQSNNDSLNIKGNSWGLRLGQGFDFFKNNKSFDFLVYYGLGISRKNVDINETNFYNPEISVLSGLLIRVQYKMLNIALGVNGGIDLSSNKWRTSSNEQVPLKGFKQHFYEPFISIGYNKWNKNSN